MMGRPAFSEPPRKLPTRAAWAERLIEHATIRKPDGSGPFPTVFQFHGCGGLRPLQIPYAEAAVKAGWAVVTVDSFRPRGLSRIDGSLLVCSGLALHGAERAADVFALLDWSRRQSWIRPGRIVLSGWSHGGWTVMDAFSLRERAGRFCRLADAPAGPLTEVAGAILIYPYAAFPSMTIARGWGEARPRVFALLAGRDQVVGTRFPQRAFDRLERDGVKVERLVFPDATHAFDEAQPSDPRTKFRPDLFEEAQAWYADCLNTIGK